MSEHEPQHLYDGPARLESDQDSWEVEVALRGAFQPIDGHFHWYGRVATALDGVRNGQTVTVRTDHGAAEGRLSDLDPWGRFRVSGTGRPPF
ncbi:DUF4873 domain-containing protein [Nocardioides luteus]|uniref:DUF4873 domain-containing protein n=1 Tax=Nocardioides luteus TaxID=1844 RepID=A0A1J4N9N5_9ACTN|nr:DUF4873 domain-containing protein [Nocardioides luteus]OIJ28206.1 hypothetical protein UG56_003945 [Nocardioides luteus]